MKLKVLFISVFLLVKHNLNAQVMLADTFSLEVEDFFGSARQLVLPEGAAHVLVFINQNSCTKCVEIINDEIERTISKNSSVNFIYIIRVGKDPLQRKQMSEKLNFATSKSNPKYYYDIENDNAIGIERYDKSNGNFKKYEIDRTPALLIIKDRIVKRYTHDDIFYPGGGLKKHLVSYIVD